MTTYNNVLGVFQYAAHTLANTLWSERALKNRSVEWVLFFSSGYFRLTIQAIETAWSLSFLASTEKLTRQQRGEDQSQQNRHGTASLEYRP